jgi:hypothetical protein
MLRATVPSGEREFGSSSTAGGAVSDACEKSTDWLWSPSLRKKKYRPPRRNGAE